MRAAPIAILVAVLVAMPLAFSAADAEPQTYTVSFDMGGHGAQTESQVIAAGGTVERPATPHAFGFGFLGWYTDPEFTQMWDFDNGVVQEDMTLYAMWRNHYAGTPDDRPSVTEYLMTVELPEMSRSDNDAMIIIAALVMMFMILPAAMRRSNMRRIPPDNIRSAPPERMGFLPGEPYTIPWRSTGLRISSSHTPRR